MTAPSPTSPPSQADALWAALTSLVSAKKQREGLSNSPTPKARTARALNRESQRKAEEALEALFAKVRVEVSHWHCTAITLPVHVTTCSHCGREYRHPGGGPLAHFLHDTTGATQEIANHPSCTNPSLPKKVKYLPHTVTVCEGCFGKETIPQADWEAFGQKELPNLELQPEQEIN